MTPAESALRNALVRQAVRAICNHDRQSALDIILCSIFCQWQMREEHLARTLKS